MALSKITIRRAGAVFSGRKDFVMTFNLSGDEALQIITSIRLQIDDNKGHKRLVENLRHMLAIYNSKIDTLTELANKLETEMNKQ